MSHGHQQQGVFQGVSGGLPIGGAASAMGTHGLGASGAAASGAGGAMPPGALRGAALSSAAPPAAAALQSAYTLASRSNVSGSNIKMGAECGNVSIVLQNIVATADVLVGQKRQLDLKLITSKARFAEYNPKKFAAVIMRLRSPKTTALMFESGKIVVTGARSVADAESATRKFVKIIKFIMNSSGSGSGADVPVKMNGPRFQNMVGVADCKFPIRLEGLSVNHMPHCSYEPELFPGLIYKLRSPKTVVIVFVSGKVVITGAKSVDDIKAAMTAIYPILVNFRKPTRSSA